MAFFGIKNSKIQLKYFLKFAIFSSLLRRSFLSVYFSKFLLGIGVF